MFISNHSFKLPHPKVWTKIQIKGSSPPPPVIEKIVELSQIIFV